MSELWFSRNHNYVKTACVCFDFGIMHNDFAHAYKSSRQNKNRKNSASRVVQQIYTSFVTVNFGNIMPDRKTKRNNSKNMIVLCKSCRIKYSYMLICGSVI